MVKSVSKEVLNVKYNAFIWAFMTHGLKPKLKKRWNGDVNEVIQRSKPIDKDLLAEVEGVSDKNPMAYNITMAFVVIAVWLASERRISPDVMDETVKAMLDSKVMKMMAGMVNLNTGVDICDYWIYGDKIKNPQ